MSRNTKLIEDSILEDWLSEMFQDNQEFVEPIIDSNMSAIMHVTCETLHQDKYVFVMAVDMLEKYIVAKTSKDEQMPSRSLMIATAIFAASKLSGGQAQVKLTIDNLINSLKPHLRTGFRLTKQMILQAETDMYNTLQWKLPSFSLLDDVNMIVEMFMRKWHLKSDLHPLAIQMTAHLYLIRMRWFKNLKETYRHSEDALTVFELLTSKRCYLPAGVLISCLSTTDYANMLDLDSILNDLADSLKIHSDHLNLLVKQIVQDCSIDSV